LVAQEKSIKDEEIYNRIKTATGIYVKILTQAMISKIDV
jgi:hypothetical protein